MKEPFGSALDKNNINKKMLFLVKVDYYGTDQFFFSCSIDGALWPYTKINGSVLFLLTFDH